LFFDCLLMVCPLQLRLTTRPYSAQKNPAWARLVFVADSPTAHRAVAPTQPARASRAESAKFCRMRHIICGVGVVLALACPPLAFGQTAPIADRVTQQNALFEEYYQTELKNSPERATSVGDYRYNDKLGQYSLAEIARRHAEADAFLARLKAIHTDGMEDKDLLSHRLLETQIEREDVNFTLKNYEMPVNQQNGVHTRLADLVNGMPFDSVPHYQDYLSRLHQIPRMLDQVTEVMRQGLKDGLMPPKLVLEKLPGQCDGVIAANPFLQPTKKFPADFSDADK